MKKYISIANGFVIIFFLQQTDQRSEAKKSRSEREQGEISAFVKQNSQRIRGVIVLQS